MNELFKPATLLTLTGCIAAEVVVVNTLRHATGWGPRWFALVLALGIAAAALMLAHKAAKPDADRKPNWIVQVFVVLLNGCLIYTSAFGVQNSVIGDAEDDQAQKQGFVQEADQVLSWRTRW